MLYDVTGVNPARDGSAPLDAGLGNRQMALNTSNIATKRILDGAISILSRTSEFIVSRIQNMSMYGEKYNNAIKKLLGENNVKLLQKGKNLHMYEYSISINIAPDAEERAEFKKTLDIALQAGNIEVSDRIDLINTRNLKIANKDLKIRISKRKRQLQLERMQEIEATNKGQERAGIAIEREKQRTFQMQIQAEQAKSAFEGKKEGMLLNQKIEGDVLLLKLKYMYEGSIADKNLQSVKMMDKYKEDRKDIRTGVQASQQSRMIDQRQNNTGAQDFEVEQELKKNPPVNPNANFNISQDPNSTLDEAFNNQNL